MSHADHTLRECLERSLRGMRRDMDYLQMVHGYLMDHPDATADEVVRALQNMGISTTRRHVQALIKYWKNAPL